MCVCVLSVFHLNRLGIQVNEASPLSPCEYTYTYTYIKEVCYTCVTKDDTIASAKESGTLLYIHARACAYVPVCSVFHVNEAWHTSE